MLLFPQTVVAERWLHPAEMHDDPSGLTVIVAVGPGRHAVGLHADGDESETSRAGETVGPIEVVANDEVEPVSPVYLPPYYRWEVDGWSFEFQSSWREAAPSVDVSRRHLRSLRRHPRALVVEPESGAVDPAAVDAPIAALVVGTPKASTDASESGGTVSVEWRGWHVVEADDPFSGPEVHVLSTHTRASRPADSRPTGG